MKGASNMDILIFEVYLSHWFLCITFASGRAVLEAHRFFSLPTLTHTALNWHLLPPLCYIGPCDPVLESRIFQCCFDMRYHENSIVLSFTQLGKSGQLTQSRFLSSRKKKVSCTLSSYFSGSFTLGCMMPVFWKLQYSRNIRWNYANSYKMRQHIWHAIW